MLVAVTAARAEDLSAQLARERMITQGLVRMMMDGLNSGEREDRDLAQRMPEYHDTPDGFASFIAENRARLQAAKDLLASDAPMTVEAVVAFRSALFDMEAEQTVWLISMLRSRAVSQQAADDYARNPGAFGEVIPKMDIMEVPDWPQSGGMMFGQPTFTPTPLAEAEEILTQLMARRVPELEVRYRIGHVRLDWRGGVDGEIARRQAVTDAQTAWQRELDSLTEAEARVQREEERTGAEVAAAWEDFERRLHAGEIDPELVASERHIRDLRIDSLLGPYHDAITLRDRQAEQVDAAFEVFSQRQFEMHRGAQAGFPVLTLVETDHARFVRLEDAGDRVTALQGQIADLRRLRRDMLTGRDNVIHNLLPDAVDAASDAANELSDAQSQSYVVQALAQGTIQLADAAVSSRGNPYAFVAAAAAQSVVNVGNWGDLNEGAETTKERDMQDRALSVMQGVAQTGFNREVADVAGDMAARSAQRVMTPAQRAVWRGSRRQALQNALVSAAQVRGTDRSFVSELGEAVVISELTERLKAEIAQSLTEPEVQAYAQAQARVGRMVRLSEFMFEKAGDYASEIANLEAELAQLQTMLAESAEQPGAQTGFPLLDEERNEPFELAENYVVRLDFAQAPPPYDVYLNDALLARGQNEHVYFISPEAFAHIARAGDAELDLRIVQRGP